jgi:hypothetical protein
VEGAAGAEVFTGFAQLNATIDHIDYVEAVEHVIDKALRDKTGHEIVA